MLKIDDKMRVHAPRGYTVYNVLMHKMPEKLSNWHFTRIVYCDFRGCRRAGLECLTSRSLYTTVFIIIAAATEDPPFLVLINTLKPSGAKWLHLRASRTILV